MSTLTPDERMSPGQVLLSPNGKYSLVIQPDGNMVVYGVMWSSQTAGIPPASLVMQGDGHLVLYSEAGDPVWMSGTSGHPGAIAELDDNGVFVVKAEDQVIWSTAE